MELQTVVELDEFRRQAADLMRDDERHALIDYLAQRPDSGVVVRGSGGVRKLRWQHGDRGRSGGLRVVTFYSGRDLPLFLITAYGKSDRANLSKAELNAMRRLTAVLKQAYGDKR